MKWSGDRLKTKGFYILFLSWNSLPQHVVKGVENAKSMSLVKKTLEESLEIKPTKPLDREDSVTTSISESC